MNIAKALALFCFVSALLTFAPAQAQQHRMRLYDGSAPGSESWTVPESTRGTTVFNVRDPEISVYLPDAAQANGAAVIVLPGGALRLLALGQETQDIIARFNARGVAVIVLKYRILQTDPNAPPPAMPRPAPDAGNASPFPHLEIRNANANPAPNDARLNEVLRFATADAQAALRLVRAHAREWRIDPNRVGMIGSSAGGGVAFGALMAQAPGATPDFIISLYGPSLQDVTVPANAPPLFLATETAHGPVTDGLIALAALWREAGKPVELHMYDVANFAMPVSLWADRAFAWMEEKRILAPAQSPSASNR